MKINAFISITAAALLFGNPLGVHAQQDDEEVQAPDFEYYTTIQRIDPASGEIFAGGAHYHLRPNAKIWIDNKLSKRGELRADMIGFKAGINAYEHHDRNLITQIHVFKEDSRDGSRAKGAR